jgi:hypothetical protein
MEGQLLQLVAHRLGDFGLPVAEVDVPDSGAAVEVLLAAHVPDEDALAPDDHHRAVACVLVERGEARQLVLAIEFDQPVGVKLETSLRLARRVPGSFGYCHR